MKTLAAACVLLVVLIASANADRYTAEWFNFRFQHSKAYASDAERDKRFKIFKANLQYIDELNAENTGVTYGVNEFADLTHEEFTARYLSSPMVPPKAGINLDEITLGGASCPSSGASTCDWREANILPPVKDQGRCGSCWAFSAIGSLEAACAQKTGKLIRLSEQQLVDCSTKFGNHGCNGGLMTYAYDYLIEAGGAQCEDSYNYTAKDGQCKFDSSYIKCKVADYVNVPKNDEAALTNLISTVGPVSVAIDAGQSSFQFYKSGVYYDARCSSTRLNHGVIAVGFGAANETAESQYYVVRNSWGTTWGNQGYILMSRGRSNNCGIATMSTYPIAA